MSGKPPRYPETAWPQARAARLASHTAAGTSASLSALSAVMRPVAARHHPVFVEAAFERAVEEHGLARRRKADQPREIRIAREDERGPSREALLQRVPELRIELGELLLVAEPDPVRRIRHEHAARRGRGELEKVH